MAGGARTRAGIPPDVLHALNHGTRETATLVEGLALDFAVLLACAVPSLPAAEVTRVACGGGIVARMALAGAVLLDHLGPEAYGSLAQHPSDTVRGWAAYLAAAEPDVAPAVRLAQIRPLADDAHFAVREWAWLALRPHLAAALPESLELLQPWTAEPSPNLRRFAVEVLRPRGVWCAHIPALKRDPRPALGLLEPLRADPVRYVQDSVANWLNDAAKTNPDTVRELCTRWRAESPDRTTERICRRALRSI